MSLKDMIYVKHALGQYGRPINVYKFRTMKAGSDENLEEIYHTENLDEMGKVIDDPRITKVGGFLRTYWIDEWPQFYNLAKGDLSLVGIRPREEEYWELFPQEHMDKALLFKPGLFGVHYSSLDIDGLDKITELEDRYLEEKLVDPVNTDKKYLREILSNIVLKGMRSS